MKFLRTRILKNISEQLLLQPGNSEMLKLYKKREKDNFVLKNVLKDVATGI